MNSTLPRPTEHQIQAEIVEAMTLAGFEVLHTTAFRQKGPSGVAKGVPDLLCFHPCCLYGALCIEVKRPGGKWTNEKQRELNERGLVAKAESAEDALHHAVQWLRQFDSSDRREASIARVKRVLKGFER